MFFPKGLLNHNITQNILYLLAFLSQSACSCTDCLDACETPVIEVEKEIFKVGQIDGVLFIMILVAGLGSAVLLPLLCYFGNEEKMGLQEGEV